jgi:predicted PurR-regulated permease PerM
MGSDDVASIIGIMFVASFIAYILYLILNYIAKHTPFGPYVSKGAIPIYIVFLASLAFLIAYSIIAIATRVRRGAQW